jgi:Cellulose biosynthesis GIL
MNPPDPFETSEPSSAIRPALSGAMAADFAIELGISGLPEFSSDMICGGLYALNVRTSSARFPLLSSSLQSALESDLRCTIVTASAPEELLQRLEVPDGFSCAELLADERLAVFSMQDEFGKKMFRYGADRLVQELEDFGVPEGSYLLFEQADDLLSLHDVGLASQQIKILAKWFKRRRITGLMAFSRSNEQKLETLNTLLDHLTGIARLGGDRDGLEITFLYWRSTPGVIAARNYRLYTAETGLYAVSRREVERRVHPEESDDRISQNIEPLPPLARVESAAQVSARAQSEAMPTPLPQVTAPQARHFAGAAPVEMLLEAQSPDTPHYYFYVDPEMDALKDSIPGVWRLVKGMENILYAAHDKPRAMIFLSSDSGNDFIELARTVHSLRKTLGLRSQILVREKIRLIDADHKQLLLHCGANVVVAKDIALEHFPKFLNSLRNQRFSRGFEPDFDAILAALPIDQEFSSPSIDSTQTGSYSYRDGNSSKSEPIAHRAIAKAKRSSLVS